MQQNDCTLSSGNSWCHSLSFSFSLRRGWFLRGKCLGLLLEWEDSGCQHFGRQVGEGSLSIHTHVFQFPCFWHSTPYLKCTGVSHLRDTILPSPGTEAPGSCWRGVGGRLEEKVLPYVSKIPDLGLGLLLQHYQPFLQVLAPSSSLFGLFWVLGSVTKGRMNWFSSFLTASLEFSFLGFIQVHLSICFILILCSWFWWV